MFPSTACLQPSPLFGSLDCSFLIVDGAPWSSISVISPSGILLSRGGQVSSCCAIIQKDLWKATSPPVAHIRVNQSCAPSWRCAIVAVALSL